MPVYSWNNKLKIIIVKIPINKSSNFVNLKNYTLGVKRIHINLILSINSNLNFINYIEAYNGNGFCRIFTIY